MSGWKILVVDDDPAIASILDPYLHEAGFRLFVARNGTEALALAASERPEIVLLDLRIPRPQGLEVLRRLRANGNPASVIVVSGLSDEVDRVVGLELGADDYVTKPFSPREVVARVKAVLRRRLNGQRTEAPSMASEETGPLEFDRLCIDPAAYTVHFDGKPIPLTRTEFRILAMLAKNASKVLTREQLIAGFAERSDLIETRTLDSHVAHLRRKIQEGVPGRELIRTIRGIGYRFDAP